MGCEKLDFTFGSAGNGFEVNTTTVSLTGQSGLLSDDAAKRQSERDAAKTALVNAHLL